MADWTIQTLYFGYTTVPTRFGLEWSIPWLGFYLTDGVYKVLCDNGVKTGFFKKNLSHFGNYAVGDESYVSKALDEIGVEPSEIDYVVYTHLHWDHAGNCHLFPQALHLLQLDEWNDFINPIPSMNTLNMYDKRVLPELLKLKTEFITGDVKLMDGLEAFHSPGHSGGSQVFRVATKNGYYILAGDTFWTYLLSFQDYHLWTDLEGKSETADPEIRESQFRDCTSLIMDHYAWYRSQCRIKGMIRNQYELLPGHEPSLIGKAFGAGAYLS